MNLLCIGKSPSLPQKRSLLVGVGKSQGGSRTYLRSSSRLPSCLCQHTCSPSSPLVGAKHSSKNHRLIVARASEKQQQEHEMTAEQRRMMEDKFTHAGGGADGVCDYQDIREALKECEGLEGDALRACWATYGCNVDTVTDHYRKAAGIDENAASDSEQHELTAEQRRMMEDKFTHAGGGADGVCDYQDIREALKECEGLEGDALKACWATYGCNVDTVTDHYKKAAGMDEGA
ncbi:hypothetical protein RI054_23g99890 [Pseudoscourfieldia marina]